jgi:hypothetical protein
MSVTNVSAVHWIDTVLVENKRAVANKSQAVVDSNQLTVVDNSVLQAGNTDGGDAHDAHRRYHALYSHRHHQHKTAVKTA